MKKTYLRVGIALIGILVLLACFSGLLKDATRPVAAKPTNNAPPNADLLNTYTDAQGVSSQYYVYSNHIDWSKPVGVMFFFDGDYTDPQDSRVYYPNSDPDLLNMAEVANDRNFLFVPVVSPDQNSTGEGITWWENPAKNGEWFRNYAKWFIKDSGVDSQLVWTFGYSGGSDFETFELGARQQATWRSGGGSIMVGGGGSNGIQDQPDARAQAMNFQWYEGSNDRAGATDPPDWSAFDTGQQGYEDYRLAGYYKSSFTIVWGSNHTGYDLSEILTQALDKANIH